MSTHEARGAFFLPACQTNPTLRSGGLKFARRELEGNSRAPTCGLVTVDLSVWGARPRKNAGSIEEVETLEGVDPTIGETFNAALAPSAEARTFTVSPGTHETLVMLEAILLAASTSASAGE